MAPKIALCLIAFTFISIQSSSSSNVTVSNAFVPERGPQVGMREVRSYSYPSREGWAKAYGRYGKYPYRFDRNSIDSISDSWGTKWLNQLRRRTGMTSDKQQMQMMGEEGGTADEPDMAGTFLSGWGSGYGKSKVNKSAVGLLGFLSLLSLIQDALMNRDMMGMMAMGGARLSGRRKKRSNQVGFTSEMIQIAQLILPVVESVELAYKGEIPVECALHPICRGNQVLTKQLGEKGKVVGTILSETFSKTLKSAGNRWKANSWDQNKVRRAGIAGRSNKNCNSLYKTCFY